MPFGKKSISSAKIRIILESSKKNGKKIHSG